MKQETVWLASYPKSGNTWLRMLISALDTEAEAVDINRIERGAIASGRKAFDNHLLIDSSLLTHDEIDALRPRLYEEIAAGLTAGAEDPEKEVERFGVRYAKVHDAYTLTAAGEPLLAGRRGAKGAIVIVRDPRDVAPSLANHMLTSLEKAITFLNNPDAGFCTQTSGLAIQLRQKLPGWSGHVASWLDQRDIPVHIVRYEDLKRDTAAVLRALLDFSGAPVDENAIAHAIRLTAFDQLQAQERETGFAEWAYGGSKGKLFFRRGESGSWREELSSEQVLSIEQAHGPMMRRLGYDLSSPP